jgi:hypothetical protein
MGKKPYQLNAEMYMYSRLPVFAGNWFQNPRISGYGNAGSNIFGNKEKKRALRKVFPPCLSIVVSALLTPNEQWT